MGQLSFWDTDGDLLDTDKLERFRNREVKARDIFNIVEIDKRTAYNFVKRYHYLGEAKFFSKFSFGLYMDSVLCGVSTFSNPQGTNALKGWFGLSNDDQSVLELTRLCMLPELNGTNATSYLLSNSMKMLKPKGVRAVITLADDSRHVGSIYQVCNFKYYGLSDSKTDFYDETGKLNPRGSTRNKRGVWIPRTRKHRYAFLLDKRMEVLIDEVGERPKDSGDYEYVCCGGSERVFDKRFETWYTCPRCTGKIEKI